MVCFAFQGGTDHSEEWGEGIATRETEDGEHADMMLRNTDKREKDGRENGGWKGI